MMKYLMGTFLCMGICMTSFGQKKDSLIRKLDSLGKKEDSLGYQENNTERGAFNQNTRITPATYVILLGSDLKQEFTKPFHMNKRDWRYAGLFAVGAGALALADESIQQYALDLRNKNADVRNIGKYVTNFGGSYEIYTLAAFGAYGWIFKNEKIKTTTLLATQAYITGGVVEAVLKTLSGRQRPNYYNENIKEAEPRFRGPFANLGIDANGNKLNSAFPSGHTTVAFAAATVFALEYRDRPWIPIFSYSAASLIGLSRITENKHWATDVLVGAALGFLTGKQVVYNYHRYATLKNSAQKKNSASFNLQYNFGHLMPGLVYSFR